MKLIDILYCVVAVVKIILVIVCMLIIFSEPIGYSTGEDYVSDIFWIANFSAIIYLLYLCWKNSENNSFS